MLLKCIQSKNQIIKMSWYGNYSPDTKVLDALIDRKPPLSQLLLCPEFIPNLKLFNPKLLDYLTNSSSLPLQIVNLLVIPPNENDSLDRKYRLPLLTIQMIQSQTTCIINALFKMCKIDSLQIQVPGIAALFYIGVKQKQILPLLAGYIQRTILVLYRTRYKETVDVMYNFKDIFDILVEASSNTCMAAILSLFLNLEITKYPASTQQKAMCKIVVVRKIMEKMSIDWRKNCNQKIINDLPIIHFQNLANIVRDIVEKYCLVSDGKAMLQVILEQKHINLFMQCTAKQTEFSFPSMDLILTLIKYYSFSAFNSEQGSEQLAKKNMQRLQSQNFIIKLINNFAQLLNIAKSKPQINLYCYKLLQVLCHCMTLSSKKMFQKIKQTQLYPTLIELLVKHESCNILHKLIERAFLHIFVTDKKIYGLYKKYLFCQISIIDLTVNKMLIQFPENGLQQAIKKAYFGIFMKIVKIYSAIETTDEQIRQAITSKSDIWNKMSKKFIKPYENITKQKLGQITKNDQLVLIPLEFMIRKIENTNPTVQIFSNSQVNLVNKAIKQIKEQQQKMPKTLELNSNDQKINQISTPSKQNLGISSESPPINKQKQQEQDGFFRVPQPTQQRQKKQDEDQSKLIISNPLNTQKQSSFSDFMNKQMAEAQKQIKRKRSLSSEQRLGSAGKKTRLMSPSPNRKRNSWKQGDDQKNSEANNAQKKDKKISLTKDVPKIPMPSSQNNNNNQQSLSKSAVHQIRRQQPIKQYSQSMVNLQSLKRTKIVRVDVKPQQKKKYRKVEQRDKPLLMYLGIIS